MRVKIDVYAVCKIKKLVFDDENFAHFGLHLDGMTFFLHFYFFDAVYSTP